MKKLTLVSVLVVLLVGIFTFTFAQDYPARKVLAGTGEIQRFVDFKFEVPFGDCNQVDTYQYIRYSGWGEKGHWLKKEPGTLTEKGWYRFINKDAGICPSKFSIEGKLDFLERMESWWTMELEPEEIGLFVKGKWSENNFFHLSANDSQYSYYLVASGYELTTSLDVFFGENNEFVYMIGRPIGAIIADSRGFLKKIIWKRVDRKGDILNNDIVFSHDDLIVLIYKEAS